MYTLLCYKAGPIFIVYTIGNLLNALQTKDIHHNVNACIGKKLLESFEHVGTRILREHAARHECVNLLQ